MKPEKKYGSPTRILLFNIRNLLLIYFIVSVMESMPGLVYIYSGLYYLITFFTDMLFIPFSFKAANFCVSFFIAFGIFLKRMIGVSVEREEIRVGKLFRKKRCFFTSKIDVSYYNEPHTVFGKTLYRKYILRLLSKEEGVVDVHLLYFSKKKIEQLVKEIISAKKYLQRGIKCS